MRLVGAEDRFIKTPLYIEGMVLGLVGGVLGIAVLFAAFIVISVNLDDALIPAAMQIRFLPPHAFGGILVSSVLVGWLGCFVSLKQFLRS
jgi:cell division transport system permease protein